MKINLRKLLDTGIELLTLFVFVLLWYKKLHINDQSEASIWRLVWTWMFLFAPEKREDFSGQYRSTLIDPADELLICPEHKHFPVGWWEQSCWGRGIRPTRVVGSDAVGCALWSELIRWLNVSNMADSFHPHFLWWRVNIWLPRVGRSNIKYPWFIDTKLVLLGQNCPEPGTRRLLSQQDFCCWAEADGCWEPRSGQNHQKESSWSKLHAAAISLDITWSSAWYCHHQYSWWNVLSL